jgi:hypothetical protein
MPSLDTVGSLADRLLKLAIVLVLLLTLLGPVLMITLHVASPRIVDAVVRYASGKQYTSSDETRITTGPDHYTVEDLQSRLVGISAYRGEARGAAKLLQVLLLRQDRTLPADARSRAFAPLKLDLSGVSETATVIIPDRPVLMDLGSGVPVRRAMLAVEGVAPFDLKGAPQGLLAGFRIASLGGGLVARPEQFIERRDPRIFVRQSGTG